MEPALYMIILYSQVRQEALQNASFTPGVCGYMCPTRCSTVQYTTVHYTCSTRSRIRFTPRFFEYKVVWPNRGGGFGITEIVDVVNLQTEEARRYHEPRVLDTSIFFPMNWTFQLTCDRIRPDDCVFNPVTDTKQPRKSYDVKLNNLQVTIVLAFLVVTSYGTESADAYFVCTCFLLLYVCI